MAVAPPAQLAHVMRLARFGRTDRGGAVPRESSRQWAGSRSENIPRSSVMVDRWPGASGISALALGSAYSLNARHFPAVVPCDAPFYGAGPFECEGNLLP